MKNREKADEQLSEELERLRRHKAELEAALARCREMEKVLQCRNCQLELLNEASRAFASTLDLDEVLVAILEKVRVLLNIVACSLWLIDRETGELVCRQVADPASMLIRGWRLKPDEGLSAWVFGHSQSVIVPDTRLDPRHYKEIDRLTGLEIRSILSVPLRVQEKVIGTLEAVDASVDRFSQGDLALLEPLAGAAAMAIDNARLYEQARQDAETRAMLLEEVNHRVSNNLATIVGLLYVEQYHAGMEDNPTFRRIMGDLINRIQGLSKVHHMLSEAEWSDLSLNELTEEIVHSALQALPPDKQVKVQVVPCAIQVTPRLTNSLALIINELTTNTVKYGLPADGQGYIAIRIEQQGEDVLLEYRDNGPGYPPEVLRLECHNVGWKLIQSLVQSGLEGEVTVRNDEGAVAAIRFPLKG